jgi:thioredoxin-related protein
MATTWLLLIVSGLWCPTLIAEEPDAERDPREFFFTQSFGDLPEELQQAREAGKLGMVLFFEMEGCPSCRYMMKNVLNQVAVQDWYAEHFVSIAVDINGAVELRDLDGITLPSRVFAAHRRVKTTPVMSFIDLNGAEVHRRSSVVKSPEEFLLMGQYVAEGHYTDTPWREYFRQKTAQQKPANGIPLITDLNLEAGTAAGRRIPILLVVTRQGCPYCARLRKEVLVPMIRSGEYNDRVLIRELMMDPDTEIAGFEGQATTTAAVARQFGIEITPTVILLDSSGQPLHEPVIGINNADMYSYYLDRAIEKALAELPRRKPETNEENLR